MSPLYEGSGRYLNRSFRSRPGRATAPACGDNLAVAPPRQRRAAGFSLVEILVVMFVIAMVTSMVSLSISSGGQGIRLESAVRDLADTAAYALDEAQFTGLDYGLLVEQNFDPAVARYSYAWRERHLEGWKLPRSGKEVFASRDMPEGVVLELEIENSPFSEVDLDDDEGREQQPQIVFYSSGETTVGAINVRSEQDSELLWRIEWDLLGRFQVLRRGIPEEEEG